MTHQPTAQQFDAVINDFYLEMDYANDERLLELQEVINILQEEKAARGLWAKPHNSINKQPWTKLSSTHSKNKSS